MFLLKRFDQMVWTLSLESVLVGASNLSVMGVKEASSWFRFGAGVFPLSFPLMTAGLLSFPTLRWEWSSYHLWLFSDQHFGFWLADPGWSLQQMTRHWRHTP